MAMLRCLVILASSQVLVLVNAVPASENKMDMKGVMNKCNESNPIDPAYLEELNMTGSFPDENVKSAKCFIRCMFMETGLMDSEGNLIADKLKDAFKNRQEPAVSKVADLEKFLDTCVTKSADVKNQCERAYQFSKCLMTQPVMFERLEQEEGNGDTTIRDAITGFLRDMGQTVLTVLNILNQIREAVSAALSG